MPTNVTVMVVDDHPVFRRAARSVIESTAGFEQVGDAASGAEALRRATQLRPDMVLVDVYMPEMDGFQTARRLIDPHPRVVVVLVSLEDVEEELSNEMSSCGAAAFIRKQDLAPAVLRGLWTAHGQRG